MDKDLMSKEEWDKLGYADIDGKFRQDVEKPLKKGQQPTRTVEATMVVRG
jgi:hypothetical protein